MAGTAQQTTSQVSGRAQQMYNSNPLIGDVLAAAVGAALGSSLPVSRQEQEKLGDIAAKARDMASEQNHLVTSRSSLQSNRVDARGRTRLPWGRTTMHAALHLMCGAAFLRSGNGTDRSIAAVGGASASGQNRTWGRDVRYAPLSVL